ncbi:MULTISPECIES: lipid-A-disaccharide synthase-related protein [unclassified Meiothermus]|uniref:lipid-A-disaccharide synthase-related protein n=1 Tax=unclassified Meiothermus TaxID=370471 RepID=UPI000D7BC7F1|nr:MULTISPECIES: lipid-A-disaccharide synthase-related protein [unclassified Meiothermus]PZA07016.1 lipid-A-disaccharide synthase [Meiothermus sp. Pnk-1]RYM35282.1 lipid-A-disaccharide synthase [Meiothermus sp. PNK-Is4]
MLLIISNGNAEDLIGSHLLRFFQVPARALPLVGRGLAYERVGAEVIGPRQEMPSGGFPFGSLHNLIADLRSGFISQNLKQWEAAFRGSSGCKAIVAVGDAYTLLIGVAFGRGLPLFHINPLVSAYYLEGQSLQQRLSRLNELGAEDFLWYERWAQRRARAVYVRDQVSEARLKRLGIPHARFYGSFAMDILPPPQKQLRGILDGRPVIALLPGSRGDVAFSLPRMLKATLYLNELQPLVAWPLGFEGIRVPEGWTLALQGEEMAIAHKGQHRVFLLRGYFSEILHHAKVALGTAGTANEQAAGLGIPVVGFPTPGPQFTLGFAQRQRRLLGPALTLAKPEATEIAQAVRAVLEEERYRLASAAGKTRIGPPGALPRIAKEIQEVLGG